MSLHCPATLIVARADGAGRPLLDRVRDRNIAGVFTSAHPEVVLAGRSLAAELGTAVTTLPELDPQESEPSATVRQALAHLEKALHSLADLHRGESVVVLTRARAAADWAAFEVEIGDDGVRVVEVTPGHE